jgi:hypothetical protein
LVAGHERVPPQLSEIVVLQRPWQVPSVQHESSLMHFWPVPAHAVDPFAPQLTVWLQLFVVLPHALVPQAALVDSAVQPHELFVHVSPPAHMPQSMGLPQLSVVGPQRLVHHPGAVVHRHSPVDGWQPQPVGQLFAQFHSTPHESVPGAQWVWQYVGSGVQPSPASGGAVSSGASVTGASAAGASPSSVASGGAPVSLPGAESAVASASVPDETSSLVTASKVASSPAASLRAGASTSDASPLGMPSSIPRKPAHPMDGAAPTMARRTIERQLKAKRVPRPIA